MAKTRTSRTPINAVAEAIDWESVPTSSVSEDDSDLREQLRTLSLKLTRDLEVILADIVTERRALLRKLLDLDDAEKRAVDALHTLKPYTMLKAA